MLLHIFKWKIKLIHFTWTIYRHPTLPLVIWPNIIPCCIAYYALHSTIFNILKFHNSVYSMFHGISFVVPLDVNSVNPKQFPLVTEEGGETLYVS